MRAKIRLTIGEMHDRLGLPHDVRIVYVYAENDPNAIFLIIESDDTPGGITEDQVAAGVETPYVEPPESIAVTAALTYARSDWKNLPKWMRDAYEAGHVLFLDKRIEITTAEGWLIATPNNVLVYRGTIDVDGRPAVRMLPAPRLVPGAGPKS